MAIILDSQRRQSAIKAEIKEKIRSLPRLCLASVAIGEDASVKSYRFSQEQIAKELGVEYRPLNLKPEIPFPEFKSVIKKLNEDKSVTGIILNKPFPLRWKDGDVFSLLDDKKDVEGMHPVNLGKFLVGEPKFISPTVLSVIELLREAEVEIYGKKAVLVGFSSLIGRPLALWLGNEFATVSITHIATYQKGDIPFYLKSADIVISAVGKPGFIKGEWIKKGAVVIDVGTASKDGKIAGDVEFEEARQRASHITPVSGGVGRLTTLFLYKNLILASE